MARRKRASAVQEKAQRKLAGLKSVDPILDLGGGLTLAAFEAKIDSLAGEIEEYNQKLSELDTLAFTLEKSEKALLLLDSRMLAGVAARYGRDSSEYEAAGGTRTSERKAPVRKVKPPLKEAA